MKLHRVLLDLLDLQVLALPYLLFHLSIQQHQQHLEFLVDQLVLEFLVCLEFLANLPDLADQPFPLDLQHLLNLEYPVGLVIQLIQLDPKLSLLVH